MTGDVRKTVIDYAAGEKTATFFSSEAGRISQIWKLKEQYPDEVEIRYVNPGGNLIARIPAEWFKVKLKKKIILMEGQITASKVRLERGRLKRLEMLGNDAHMTDGRNNKIRTTML